MRFSIRDLLWATLVVAMGLGWWVQHLSTVRDFAEQQARLEGKHEAEIAQIKAQTVPISSIRLRARTISHLPSARATIKTVDGDISLSIGMARIITAPRGSATAGSEWLEVPMRFTNTSNRPLWVPGYSLGSPFYTIETRSTPSDEWAEYPISFCGTGALLGPHPITPGASASFDIALPKGYEGYEFRVSLPYCNEDGVIPSVQARSEAKVLGVSASH